jgi:serine/threonine-protein kinase
MGGVYLAKAVAAGGADKVVAVKLLHEHLAADEAVVAMFLDEARIVSAINHVNVSSVFDFGEQEGLYFLVMEYLEGEALDRVLKSALAGTQPHPLHPWLVARVLADAAEGLHAAHEVKGADGAPLEVVHRDVSPHNIFVTYDGVTKVVDFGIARARERSTATEAGTFKGKFEYASPEQIKGGQVDRRADLWALGVCLWELVTGARLFQRADPAATGRAVIGDPIPLPSSVGSHVPAAFDDITMKALQRDPARRFATAREFARALREVLARSGESIDAPLVGEWLEELFPGDRARRQALFSAVRRSGPDAPLEPVPAELRVKGTGTGSSRNYRTGSNSGQGATRREGSGSGAKQPAPDPERSQGTVVQDHARAASRTTPIIAAVAVVVALGAGGLFVASRHAEVTTESPILVQPITPIGVTPPPSEASPVMPNAVTPPSSEASPVMPIAVTPPPNEASPVALLEPDAGLALSNEEPDAGEAAALADLPDAGPAPIERVEVVKAALPRPTLPVAVRPKSAPLPPKPAPVDPPRSTGSARGDGRVRFKTPGAVAEIIVDGKVLGPTPMTVDLSAGTHTFELRATGFDFGGPQQLKVQVGGDYNVEIDLR